MRFFPTLGVLLLTALPLAAQDADLSPIPLDAATLNISGTWSYSTAENTETGPCPVTAHKQGELSIALPEGAPAQVDVLSGELCDHPMHLLAGDIEWGNLVVGNAKVVDDEGGRAFNSMVVYFFSDNHATGLVKSEYNHPSGVTCDWTYRIEMTRP